MPDMVIFAALGWERRAVTAALVARPTEGDRVWTATLGDGARCVVMQTGIGPEHARRAAERAPQAGLYLTCGCAGALVDWLHTGDLVAAEAVVALDAPEATQPLPAVGAVLATAAAARGFRMHAGTVASSTGVLASTEAKAAAGAGGALVVDMESAAIATVAAARGTPFTALRVVLDVLGDALPTAGGMVDAASGEIRVAQAAVHYGVRPWLWGMAGRLARQQRVAARRLEDFLSVVLRAGGVVLPMGAAISVASSGG